jgi:hypothetical protein
MTTIMTRGVATRLGRARRMARALLSLAFLVTLPVTGCNLEVVDPDIITPDNLEGEAALPTIRAAALGDFALAYSGSGADGSRGTEGVIMAGGMLADEFINSETFPTRVEIDRRATQLTNGTLTGWFRTISRARRSQEFAFGRYRALASDTTAQPGLSEMLSLSGYTYLFFAENYCSGVPFSTANDDGSLVFGTPLTTAQMLDTAEARFNAALAAATALDTLKGVTSAQRTTRMNLARVGLARALLDQATTSAGFDTAARVVGGATPVPTTFVYLVGHSQNTIRQENGVFNATVFAERYAVADGEGTNGLRYRTQIDGRVPSGRFPSTDVGFDGVTAQIDQQRFGDNKASIPLATGAEARLIEAEALLVAGDTAGALAIHNTLRAAAPSYFAPANETRPIAVPYGSLVALTATDVTNAGGAVNLHFKERAFWLWLSGHRLEDLRRLTHAPYNRGPETVFPTGAYFKGGVYGTDYNFPVPFDETNNPNFTQCLNRNP